MSQKKKQDQKGSGLIVYNGPLYMSKACLLSLTPVPSFIQLDSYNFPHIRTQINEQNNF